jgi:hypothetical protein
MHRLTLCLRLAAPPPHTAQHICNGPNSFLPEETKNHVSWRYRVTRFSACTLPRMMSTFQFCFDHICDFSCKLRRLPTCAEERSWLQQSVTNHRWQAWMLRSQSLASGLFLLFSAVRTITAVSNRLFRLTMGKHLVNMILLAFELLLKYFLNDFLDFHGFEPARNVL